MKMGLLVREKALSAAEERQVEELKQKVHTLGMTVVSFYRVDFTYDRAFLELQLVATREILFSLAAAHLTPKSRTRITLVFDAFLDPAWMDTLFASKSRLPQPTLWADGGIVGSARGQGALVGSRQPANVGESGHPPAPCCANGTGEVPVPVPVPMPVPVPVPARAASQGSACVHASGHSKHKEEHKVTADSVTYALLARDAVDALDAMLSEGLL